MEFQIPGVKATLQDRIFVQAASSVASTIVRLEVISQGHDGKDFQTTIVVAPDSDGTLSIASQLTVESIITSMNAHIQTGAPELAQCFVRAGLLRGGNTIAFSTLTLISGYLSVGSQIGWPYGRHMLPGEGPGTTVSLTIANPAVATNWRHTVADRHIIRPIAATFTLTTDANAANRRVAIMIRDPSADEITQTQSDQPQTASLARFYKVNTAPIRENPENPSLPEIPLQLIRLPPGFDIGTNTPGIQAGDQYSAIKLTFEEWVFPS